MIIGFCLDRRGFSRKHTFKTTLHAAMVITLRMFHSYVSRILAWVKIIQPNQSHTSTQESVVRKVKIGRRQSFGI